MLFFLFVRKRRTNSQGQRIVSTKLVAYMRVKRSLALMSYLMTNMDLHWYMCIYGDFGGGKKHLFEVSSVHSCQLSETAEEEYSSYSRYASSLGLIYNSRVVS